MVGVMGVILLECVAILSTGQVITMQISCFVMILNKVYTVLRCIQLAVFKIHLDSGQSCQIYLITYVTIFRKRPI